MNAITIIINTPGPMLFTTGRCLSGLVIQLVFSDGRPPVDMVFGSNPTSYHNITDNQIVGFHGIIATGDNCIRRLGVYMQLDGSELKGEPS